jgi:hypothetical protein
MVRAASRRGKGGTLVRIANVNDVVMNTRSVWLGSALVAALSVPALASPSAMRERAPVVVAYDDQTPSPLDDQPARPHNAGIVEGQVVSVDYQKGMIGLQTPRRGRVDVVVLPSTNIQGRGDSFHTIADISRGSRLRIFLSEQAGRFIAQIIHLR